MNLKRRMSLAKALWEQGVLPYFLRDYLLAPVRKARWRCLARDGGVLQMRLEPGVKLTLPGNDGVAGLIYAYHYEVGEREFVRRYLQIGDTFVDAGAHIGLFTLIAAHKVGPAGKVIAFEPCKTSFEVLKANIALNGLSNVKCENMALSNRKGTAQFHSYLGEGRAAFSSLSAVPDFREGCAEPVATTTLDRYMDGSGIDRIDLVKLDVEGWETKVLLGAQALLSAPDAAVLLVEFCDWIAENAGSSTEQLRSILECHGYRLYRYDWAEVTLVPEDAYPREYAYENLIATKDRAETSRRLRRLRRPV